MCRGASESLISAECLPVFLQIWNQSLPQSFPSKPSRCILVPLCSYDADTDYSHSFTFKKKKRFCCFIFTSFESTKQKKDSLQANVVKKNAFLRSTTLYNRNRAIFLPLQKSAGMNKKLDQIIPIDWFSRGHIYRFEWNPMNVGSDQPSCAITSVLIHSVEPQLFSSLWIKMNLKRHCCTAAQTRWASHWIPLRGPQEEPHTLRYNHSPTEALLLLSMQHFWRCSKEMARGQGH